MRVFHRCHYNCGRVCMNGIDYYCQECKWAAHFKCAVPSDVARFVCPHCTHSYSDITVCMWVMSSYTDLTKEERIERPGYDILDTVYIYKGNAAVVLAHTATEDGYVQRGEPFIAADCPRENRAHVEAHWDEIVRALKSVNIYEYK